MRSATIRLQLESDAASMVRHELRTLNNEMKDVVMEVTELKKRKFELKVNLRQRSEHAVAAKEGARGCGIEETLYYQRGACGKPCGMRQFSVGP